MGEKAEQASAQEMTMLDDEPFNPAVRVAEIKAETSQRWANVVDNAVDWIALLLIAALMAQCSSKAIW